MKSPRWAGRFQPSSGRGRRRAASEPPPADRQPERGEQQDQAGAGEPGRHLARLGRAAHLAAEVAVDAVEPVGVEKMTPSPW